MQAYRQKNLQPHQLNQSHLQEISVNTAPTRKITQYWRVSRIIAHTLLGLSIAVLMLPFASKTTHAKIVRWWCKHLLGAFNIQVRCSGFVPDPNVTQRNTMFVGNHISWSDIHALNSIVPLRFIAKSDIRQWPIFGYLAEKNNTLFIDRSNKRDAKRTIESAVASLNAGDNLCFFPEGTTTDGTTIQPFKTSLIQAAIEAKSTIWPVAIFYPNEQGKANTKAAYADDTTLQASMQNILAQQQPVIELHFLKPISPEQVAAFDRRNLTIHIEQLIRNQLGIHPSTK
jgi:1-acyl-sn-glycerol-3-phosphate acyltransferase